MVQIPEAYQRGYLNFLNCRIDLSKRVLIPREETKYWANQLIKEIKKENEKIEALDIFAGSGCIGISILKNTQALCKKMDFIDISQKSIDQIKINLKLNKIPKKKYNVFKSSFFEKVKNKKYDLILANPPYVAMKRIDEVGSSVLEHEPKEALFSGEEGMDHIRKFLNQSFDFLKKKGIIYLEFDPQQKGYIQEILKNNKFSEFNFFKDQFQKYRFIKIKK